MKLQYRIPFVVITVLCVILGVPFTAGTYTDNSTLDNPMVKNIPLPDPSYGDDYERLVTFANNSWNLTAAPFPISISGNGSSENPYTIKDSVFAFDPDGNYHYYESVMFEINIGSNCIIFENCEFSTTYEYVNGIFVQEPEPNHQIVIRNCSFSNFRWRVPLYMYGIENGIIEGCSIKNSYNVAISSCRNMIIHNNSFYQSTSRGIYVYENNNTVISHNEFNYMGYIGIAIVYTSYNNSIIFNTIRYSPYGIVFYGYKERDYEYYGFFSRRPSSPWRYHAPDDTILANNTIEYILANGINIPYSNSTQIVNNTVSYCGFHGIGIGECRDTVIRSNNIEGCGANGIYLQECNYTQIQTNLIENSGENGIYVNESRYIDAIENTIKDSIKNGIYLQSSKKKTVKDNKFEGNRRNVRGVVGAFYLNNTPNEIAAAYLGGFFIIFVFTALHKYRKLKKDKKKYGWKRKIRSLKDAGLIE